MIAKMLILERQGRRGGDFKFESHQINYDERLLCILPLTNYKSLGHITWSALVTPKKTTFVK
jgi:hypothetical protein